MYTKMETSYKLATCPKCLSKAESKVSIFTRFKNYIVQCSECGMRTRDEQTIEEAVDVWNRGTIHSDEAIKQLILDAYIKGQKDAITIFTEKFIYKAICEGCSGCCNCYEEGKQSECEDWKFYMQISEQLKAGGKNG